MKRVFTLLLLLGSLQIFASPYNFLSAPTAAPTNFVASSNEGNSISLNWTSGNGAKRIVIARKEAAVTFLPVNGVSYNANTAFGAGKLSEQGGLILLLL